MKIIGYALILVGKHTHRKLYATYLHHICKRIHLTISVYYSAYDLEMRRKSDYCGKETDH